MSLPWKKRISIKEVTDWRTDKMKAQVVCCAIILQLVKEYREDTDLQEIYHSMCLVGKSGGEDFDKLLEKLFLWGDLNRIWFDTKF